jgi:plastocyanin domain-containing protein
MRTLSMFTLVLALGLAAGCARKAAVGPGQNVAIQVTENGFEPAVVTVKAGEPVTLHVTRRTDRTCATDLVMAEHNINQPLPLNQEVLITFTPKKAGDLTYACPMDMYHGTIHVE